MKSILSLCDLSGSWSLPYVEAGYEVVQVDVLHPSGCRKVAPNVWRVGCDLLDVTQQTWYRGLPFHGVLAAPPCTCFCRPAARWWARQDAEGKTDRDVALIRRCLDLCQTATAWWALENPPGRAPKLIPELGRPAWQFHPWHYGDPWRKQTYIWGTAVKPPPTVTTEPPRLTYRTPNGRLQGRISRMSSSWQNQRSETPAGFARAFCLANP
jgi:hypothetical protein